MKTTPRSNHNFKLRLYAAFMVVLSILFYVALYFEVKRERLMAEKVVQEAEVKENTELFRTRLKQALDNSKEKRGLLEAHFVQQSGVVDFIEGLEKLGTDTGVEAHISSLNEAFDNSGALAASSGKLALSLQVTGSFAGVYKYLLLLEQVPQKLDIKSVQLQSSAPMSAPTTKKQAAGTQAITWTAEIRADVLHYMK